MSTGAQIVGAAKIRSVVDWKLVNDVEFIEVDDIPVEKYHVAMNKDVEQFEHMHGIQVVELQNKEVGVLIETDCADVFSILEVRKATNQEPIAWKTAYEWCLLGQSGSGHDGTMFNAFINAKKSDDAVHEKLEQHFRQDFPKAASQEDHKKI